VLGTKSQSWFLSFIQVGKISSFFRQFLSCFSSPSRRGHQDSCSQDDDGGNSKKPFEGEKEKRPESQVQSQQDEVTEVSQQLTVRIPGTGEGCSDLPFELSPSVETGQLVVKKVIKKEDDNQVQLREGDIVLEVNGQKCQGLESVDAMKLIKSSGQEITLEVSRKPSISDNGCSMRNTGSRQSTIEQDTKEEIVFPRKHDPEQLPASQTDKHLSISETRQQFLQSPVHQECSVACSANASDNRSKPAEQQSISIVETEKKEYVALNSKLPHQRVDIVRCPTSNEGDKIIPQTSLLRSLKSNSSEDSKDGETSLATKQQILTRLMAMSGAAPMTSAPTDFIIANRKQFADSSFYNDPDHKYPTIDEQIQLARRVALSVFLPDNYNCRGHKMFLKCKARSDRWTTGVTEEELAAASLLAELDEKYYKMEPWNSKPFEPKPGSDAAQPTSSSAFAMFPKSVVFAPKFNSEMTEDNFNALSFEERERYRLLTQKTRQSSASPQVCINFADNLRNSKDKGGQLFAKRQAKSESWGREELSSSDSKDISKLSSDLREVPSDSLADTAAPGKATDSQKCSEHVDQSLNINSCATDQSLDVSQKASLSESEGASDVKKAVDSPTISSSGPSEISVQDVAIRPADVDETQPQQCLSEIENNNEVVASTAQSNSSLSTTTTSCTITSV
jgi:hypothetical protein